jgi:hypothetical protein
MCRFTLEVYCLILVPGYLKIGNGVRFTYELTTGRIAARPLRTNFQKVPDLPKKFLTNKKWCQIGIIVT